MPTDASALESSISALESAISALESAVKSLESSSVPWEYSVWVFTFLVVVGVAMELWVIRHEWRDDMESWALAHFGVIRSVGRPSIPKLRVELASVLLITLGVAGELAVGVEITVINGKLRGKSAELRIKGAELRNKSDQLVALLHGDTEDERMARVKLQKLVAWRTIDEKQRKEIGARLRRFSGVRIAFILNAGDPEAFAFGTQIASIAVKAGWTIVSFGPVMHLGAFPTGVHITTTGDQMTRDASDALTRELNRLHFDAVRSPEIDTRPTDPLKQPLMAVSVELRPQAVPNEISRAIASQK